MWTTYIVENYSTCNLVTRIFTRLTILQNVNRSLSSKRTVCVCFNLAFCKARNSLASPPNEFDSCLQPQLWWRRGQWKRYQSPWDEWISSYSPVSEASPHTAPNPFEERGETTALVVQHHATDAGGHIITNPLDEQQELILQWEECSTSHL